MSAVNFRLLECLRVLVEEKHVSRAADRLGLTQPKLSGTLARLRQITGDPLLVRTPTGMIATDTAQKLAQHAETFLKHWDEVIQGGPFDPGAARLIVRVQVMDALVPLLLAPALARTRGEAPGCTVSLVMPSLSTMRESLENGDVDLAIGIIPELPPDLYVSRLMSCYWCCIAAKDHPRIAGGLSLEGYAQEAHVVSTFGRPTQLSLTEKHMEAALDEAGVRRTIGAYVPTMLSIPDLVAAGDLVGLVPQPVAERAATRLPLQILPPPVAMPPHDLVLIWHARTHNDGAQRWFREQLRATAHEIAWES